MTTTEALDALALRLREGARAITQQANRVAAGEPWPLSDNFSHTPEAHWGPPEILAHVAEMLPFWTGEIERVIAAASEEPVPFGRTGDDPLRLGVLERDRTLPSRELFSRIEAGADRLARRLEAMDVREAARVGVHRTVGELTVAEIAERFVARHLEEHADQLASG